MMQVSSSFRLIFIFAPMLFSAYINRISADFNIILFIFISCMNSICLCRDSDLSCCMGTKWGNVWTWNDAKRQIDFLLKADGRPKTKIFSAAGLSRDIYYKAFGPGNPESRLRKQSVQKLAAALNISVAYFFEGSAPFFGNVLLKSISGENVSQLTARAIDFAGSMDLLAERLNVQPFDIMSIVDPESQRKTIPISTFHEIALIANLEITTYGDQSIELKDIETSISRLQVILPERTFESKSSKLKISLPKISDQGLIELLAYSNRALHTITDTEVATLSQIHKNHETSGTIVQWKSLLYAIRGLNTGKP